MASKAAQLIRRYLLPGESALAGLGIGMALATLVSTCLSVVWAMHTERTTALAVDQQRVEASAQLLGGHIEALLERGDVAGIRRLMITATQTQGLVGCRVTTAGNRVLADIDPRQVNTEKVSQAQVVLSEDSPVVIHEDDTCIARVPLRVGDDAVAMLEVTVPFRVRASTFWHLPIGLSLGGALLCAVLMLFYRSTRKKVCAAVAIREALLDLSQTETNESIARLNADLGAEATAWNGLLERVESLRAEQVSHRASEIVHRTGETQGDLKAACDAMADGLVLLSAKQTVIYANGAAAVFLKHNRDGLVNMRLEDGVDDSRLRDGLERVFQTQRQTHGIIEVDQNEEGTHGVLRLIVRPIHGAGAAARMLIIQDVTQQRIAQEAHKDFLAQAAHELRTPLTNVRLNIEAAIEDGQNDPQLRGECLNVINSEAIRLERIVADMLSVAEIEAGSMSVQNDDVQLGTMLTELERDYQKQAAAQGLTVHFHVTPKLPPVRGDQAKLMLALHNLLGNAIKYTQEGGSVTVEVESKDGQLQIRVTDTGFGMSEDDAERVFDKFYRGDDDRVRNITGSGLGLPLAREVVRRHGGDIMLETALDVGSTFTLTLPVAMVATVATVATEGVTV